MKNARTMGLAAAVAALGAGLPTYGPRTTRMGGGLKAGPALREQRAKDRARGAEQRIAKAEAKRARKAARLVELEALGGFVARARSLAQLGPTPDPRGAA